MFFDKAPPGAASREPPFWSRIGQAERRQWWLWASTLIVTLFLTAGMASFSYLFNQTDPAVSLSLRASVRDLLALLFLFDVYTIYQQLQILRIRRQLSEHVEMFHLISENAEELISVIDAQGRRLYTSPAYRKAFGYSHEQVDVGSAADQIHPDDRQLVVETRTEIFRTGVGRRIEYRFRRKDGEWRVLESTGSGVQNARGETEKLIVVSRDITERKQAEKILHQREEQLRQAKKMEAVGRLSGGIAHDFNNLLGVIIGYSEDIESRLPPSDPLRKSAGEIHKAGQRAAALTRQLLAFSRQQVLQPRVLDLNALVSDMGEMLRRLIGSHIELSITLDPQLGRIKGDQSQLEQVLVNLVVNARDAMPEGGKLLIETANVYLDESRARGLPFLRPGPHTLLTVSDTGLGMDAETLTHIFEPFFTTKDSSKGMGLGLATVYGIVQQSGGIVGVHSEPGKGSTFWTYFPHAAEQVSTPAAGSSQAKRASGTETVLVVDDTESLLELISEFLARSGYTVLSAGNGLQALALAQSFSGPIHLLLTDIVMPKLNGPALAKQMAALRPDIRILFMTGHAEPDTTLHGTIPQGSECLQKPFHRDALLQKVRHTLDHAALHAR